VWKPSCGRGIESSVGIEPTPVALQATALPLGDEDGKAPEGFEPSVSRFEAGRPCPLDHGAR
jgi:hypothetical protein